MLQLGRQVATVSPHGSMNGLITTWSYVNIRFVCVLRRRRFTTSYVITIMLLFVQLTNVSARLCSIDVIPTKK
jgi:hypothetical protein